MGGYKSICVFQPCAPPSYKCCDKPVSPSRSVVAIYRQCPSMRTLPNFLGNEFACRLRSMSRLWNPRTRKRHDVGVALGGRAWWESGHCHMIFELRGRLTIQGTKVVEDRRDGSQTELTAADHKDLFLLAFLKAEGTRFHSTKYLKE